MMSSLLGLLLAAAPAEAGLFDPSAGLYAHVGGGFGVGDAPVAAGGAWHLGLGGWTGRYDGELVYGRHWAVGPELRQDLLVTGDGPSRLRTAPMLAITRGLHLVVVRVRGELLGGPVLRTTWGADGATVLDGGTIRGAVAASYRPARQWSVFVRLEAGVDVGGRVPIAPAVGLTLGVEAFARLTHRPAGDAAPGSTTLPEPLPALPDVLLPEPLPPLPEPDGDAPEPEPGPGPDPDGTPPETAPPTDPPAQGPADAEVPAPSE